jgi:hypothetical protein
MMAVDMQLEAANGNSFCFADSLERAVRVRCFHRVHNNAATSTRQWGRNHDARAHQCPGALLVHLDRDCPSARRLVNGCR